uniref:uncharacterized protein n=1 Tax=Myxine glutinosa TaxID=7769 RepID=UPI00358EA4AB
MSLYDALTKALTEYNSCFITFESSTFAVVKQNVFYVFDSHSRGRNGTQVPDGTSVVIKYASISEVHEHCQKLAASMSVSRENCQFEVTGMDVDVRSEQSVAQQTTVPHSSISDRDVVLHAKHTKYPSHPLGQETCKNAIFRPKDSSRLCESEEVSSPHLQISSRSTDGSFVPSVSHECKSTSRLARRSNRKLKGTHQQNQELPDQVRQTRAQTKRMRENDTSKEKKRLADKTRYRKDEYYRQRKITNARKNYRCNEICREIKKARIRDLYEEHEEHQAAMKKRSTDLYANDKKHRKSVQKRSTDLYANDKKHRESVQKRSTDLYANDKKHRKSVQKRSTDLYANDKKHQAAMKKMSRDLYANDKKHRESVQKRSTDLYANDKKHRESVQKRSTDLYANDKKHRKSVQKRSTDLYANDKKHQAAMKKRSKDLYANNKKHREAAKAKSIDHYSKSEVYRENVKKRSTADRLEKKKERGEMNMVIIAFKENITRGPEYVCSVCNRIFFKKQVRSCSKEFYAQKGSTVKALAEKCILENYVHKCSEDCVCPCVMAECSASKLWICWTCHQSIMHGKMPGEAVVNNLQLEAIPEALKCLNSLEQHLIALHIPFAKMTALPKGGQHGVHGPVICVPSNVQKAITVLPRCGSDDQMIRVQLKRKLSYKGYYLYQFVNKAHIQNALNFLVQNNKWYADVAFNKDWINPLPTALEDHEEISDDDAIEAHHTQTDNNVDHEMYMDSCLQPVDIGQEILDQHFDNIMCIAPAEGNDPVKILMDESNEAKSFPVLFPTGSPTYPDYREQKITRCKYLNSRIMHADGRFARNTDYIFYAQYLSEVYQVLCSVSIALRKGHAKAFDGKVTAENLIDKDSLRRILKCDDGYKFLKPVRGTPAYWNSAEKDLLAMVRQLGNATWFCSFSAGDMRWPEIVVSIRKQEGHSGRSDCMDWPDKCALLRKNPVTVARMFDYRFRLFLKEVIMSPANPIGKIKDYFYRVEFQQRGSPHIHCLLWVEDAPKLDEASDEDVVSFIDQYVTCEVPSSHEELHDIVNSVQKHSVKHTKSCRKKGTKCRFNFPRPPSTRTFISRPGENVSSSGSSGVAEVQRQAMKKEDAKQLLERIWNAFADGEKNVPTVDELFRKVDVTQESFELACAKLTNKASVVLRRTTKDVWINQYNSDLLHCWNANMDIQYVLDAYSCIFYIISYISKAEREMGLLLDHSRKEALDGNEDARQAMKKLGGVYLHNREVSAQEAVYRVCSLRLKESSRKVQFVPTGDNVVKMSRPLHVLQNKSKGADLNANDIWMTSFVDRYKNRPSTTEFDHVCLATFCSEFRVLYKSELTKCKTGKPRSTVYKLQNGLGYVQKRTKSDPAVVRYARFSPMKEPEKYYQSILQLFLPHRCNGQLKPDDFETYQNFYEGGAVKCGNNPVQFVRDIVERNKAPFEKAADTIDKALELLEKAGPLEDAWAQICPETEVERLGCLNVPKDNNTDPEDDGDIPDLLHREKRNHAIEIRQCVISFDEAQTLLRSLNEKQRKVFYKVRQWCLNKSHGNTPDAFHVFVTGGAGTGKTHLIKTVYYEASRILARALPNPDDVSVLLTAPTGVAAFNINAATIHHAFCIGVNAKLPYQPLGEERLNSLRAKLSSLQILIIDEISMVDNKLLAYIHGRLRQIKQCRDFSPFGNVSVIAVGDFYQLSPVKGKPLHAENVIGNLWTDNFLIAELTEIMRQKDGAFAEILNRLRTRKRSDKLSAEDIHALCQRETGEENDAIHIFATNKQVDTYNMEKLHSSCSNPLSIDAEDFFRDTKSGKLIKRTTQYIQVLNSNLPRTLTLAVGARVMLTKNINVSDGLVNGVFGTVCHISQTTGVTFPSVVYVVFDNARVGDKLRKEKSIPPSLPSNSTPIGPQEDSVTNGGIRRQFPLKLSYACTIHKMQGLTLKEAVVSLKKIFSAGQAYVAVSRVTTLEGLVIQDFKESSIYWSQVTHSRLKV